MPAHFGKNYHRYPPYMGHYHDYDDDDENDVYIIIGTFFILWALYWAVVHFVDWLLGNWLPWWMEPLTLFFWLPPTIVVLKFGYNPLNWWPMVWGTRVLAPERVEQAHNIDEQKLLKKLGGPRNVWFTTNDDYDLVLKFRRRKDAVFFSMKYL